MKMTKKQTLVAILALAFSLSFLSAMPDAVQAQPLSQDAEVQAVGGMNKCAAAWGLGLALAAASLSPCGVVCLNLAWYDLALIGAYCD